jgi:hypothetical protein
MPTLEDRVRRIMADETAGLRAAPDLVERVIRSSRRKRTRTRIAVVAASVAVVAAAPVFLVTAPGTMQTPAVSQTPEPPAIDDPTPVPSDPPDLGERGDGRVFGHVRVGYLPGRLKCTRWSVDFWNKFTTSLESQGGKNGFYCVQIYVYEDEAVQEIDDQIQNYRDEGEGEEVAVGDRTGYLVVQNVGEDGMKGTPTLFLTMGDKRRAEIMFSPTYAKEFVGAKAVEGELMKIAEGLTNSS